MLSYKDLIYKITSDFNSSNLNFSQGFANAEEEAYFLVFGFLNKIKFFNNLTTTKQENLLNKKLNQRDIDSISKLANQRINKKIPIAYLLGFTYYYDLKLFVDKNTLIPRSAIAELVYSNFDDWLDLTEFKNKPLRVLDLCCGSGAIGIYITKYYKSLDINIKLDLADISDEALKIAKKNVIFHNLEQETKIIKSDLLENIKTNYDLIVTNPPYVSQEDLNIIPDEIKYEPILALESGNKGLKLVNKILKNIKNNLDDGGFLVLEVGKTKNNLIKKYNFLPFYWFEFENKNLAIASLNKDDLIF